MRRQSVNMVWLKKSNPRRLALAIDDKKAAPGYPLETCGYDKKGVCFSEVLGSGILQDDYVVETRSTCPTPFVQVGKRAKYEMIFVWRHLTHLALSISDFLRISSFGFGILQHNA